MDNNENIQTNENEAVFADEVKEQPAVAAVEVIGAPEEVEEEKVPFSTKLISFIIPLVGIILYFTNKKDHPKKSKACGKAALISIIISVVVSLIFGIFVGVAASKMKKYAMQEAEKIMNTPGQEVQIDEEGNINTVEVPDNIEIPEIVVEQNTDDIGIPPIE